MLRLSVVSALLALSVALPLAQQKPYFSNHAAEALFNSWVEQHGKVYSSESHAAERFKIFQDNLEKVQAHNSAVENGISSATYFLGLTPFADQTAEEFKAMLGYKASANTLRNETKMVGSAPDSVDWVAKGAVTPVKNQGQCGSCWAFSTTGSIEGANFLSTGKLVALSEQELLDCDDTDQGCNGGLMDNAFNWIVSNGGIDSEDDFKYLARRSFFFRCPADKKNKHVAVIKGHVDVAGTEDDLKIAVAQQPVSVAIQADQLQMYSHGIFNGCTGTINLDHGVLAVGYGSENGQDYWIVKNSWSATWGEKGYFRLARNIAAAGGECGIAQAASYPTV